VAATAASLIVGSCNFVWRQRLQEHATSVKASFIVSKTKIQVRIKCTFSLTAVISHCSWTCETLYGKRL